MDLRIPESQESYQDDPIKNDGNPNPVSNAPDKPTLLNWFAQCCKKGAASPVAKNLAGLTIATGVGATFGCPWVIGLLIAAGAGTSWVGGLGVILIGVGVTLWIASTVLSSQQADASEWLALEIGSSAVMGVIGIPYAITCALGNCCDSILCASDTPDDGDKHEPVQEQTIDEKNLHKIMSAMTPEERRSFIKRYWSDDLPKSVRSDPASESGKLSTSPSVPITSENVEFLENRSYLC